MCCTVPSGTHEGAALLYKPQKVGIEVTTIGPLAVSPTGSTVILAHYINSAECQRLLGVSKTTLQRWRDSGHGPKAYKVGRFYRYKTAEVVAYIEGRDA